MHSPIKSIRESGNIKGKRVIARMDYNVAISGGKIIEDLRIRVSLPTINYLREQGAKIILISHIETKDVEKPTLELVATELSKQLSTPVKFVRDFLGTEGKDAVNGLADGEIVLFENLRSSEGEKNNDMEFAKTLASYADLYVNDAFPVSHRAHASIVTLPKLLPHFAGFQLQNEIEHLSAVFNPSHPFVFILGGAKFETKIPLIEKFLKLADNVFVGGALMNDLFKAKGYNVGKSLVSEGNFDLTGLLGDPKLIVPTDIVLAGGSVSAPDSIPADQQIVDVGPQSIANFHDKILGAKFILWNGPLGLYEDGYKDQTIAMARAIYESTAHAVVGGGDTVAALESLNSTESSASANSAEATAKNPNIFISSGGGAMLEYLLEETLVGIDALV